MENKRRKLELAKKLVDLVEADLKPNEIDYTYSLWDALLERRTGKNRNHK